MSLLLLAVMAGGLAVPLLAAPPLATPPLANPPLAADASCEGEGEGGADCCAIECSLCVCCSHLPRSTVGGPAGGGAGEAAGRLGAAGPERPREPLPREILHVPRRTLVA